jgi:hypothetical protein
MPLMLKVAIFIVRAHFVIRSAQIETAAGDYNARWRRTLKSRRMASWPRVML